MRPRERITGQKVGFARQLQFAFVDAPRKTVVDELNRPAVLREPLPELDGSPEDVSKAEPLRQRAVMATRELFKRGGGWAKMRDERHDLYFGVVMLVKKTLYEPKAAWWVANANEAVGTAGFYNKNFFRGEAYKD